MTDPGVSEEGAKYTSHKVPVTKLPDKTGPNNQALVF